MKIAVPKEVKKNESRVGLNPVSAAALVDAGHELMIESKAGSRAGFNDVFYDKSGCIICEDRKVLHDWADMIIKVKEPQKDEVALYHENQIIFTYLHLAADDDLLQGLLDKRVHALAYETLQLDNGSLPCLKPMSQIAGRLAIQEGAKYLEKPSGGRGVLLSGVPGVRTGKVLILGAGIVGLSALKIAVGMGAAVTIMDINEAPLGRIDEIHEGRVQTLFATRANIEQELPSVDLVVGAVLIPGSKAPKLISRDMLKLVKMGAVIVDVAVDQGGCVETSRPTTHDDPVYEIDGVLHYCVSNMPGAVPLTATQALCAQTLPYIKMIADLGLEKALESNTALQRAVNLSRGQIIHPALM
ncbi:alanine dehydrogenase [Lentisphaera profundi]|uniref:Alanine dehydrogenase n=1 Tax=Lentisphaera profundi TaxID=1658616 RepID=A0ABY7VRY0_9BACT|nr:alanine dehydrogenase [Lentisphaera profundi]WDE96965.1 alanine dehydrogenase [Lentisphaera profundi]